MDWTLTQLRTFVAVADAGSMSRAAQLLGYTPGAVSQHMSALRRAAQRDLFVKDGRRRRLSEAGETLLRHAREILAAEARAADALSPDGDSPRIAVTVGVFGSVAAACAAPLMDELRRAHGPGSIVRLREVDVDAIPQAVLEGGLDIALALDYPDARRAPLRGLSAQVLHSETFSLVMASGHPLVSQLNATGPEANGSMRALRARMAEAPWVLPPVETAFGRAVRIACAANGLDPQEHHQVIDSALALGLAADGLGLALATPLMLRMLPRDVRDELAVLPLGVPAQREIVLLTRSADRGRSAVQAVARALRGTAPWEDREALRAVDPGAPAPA